MFDASIPGSTPPAGSDPERHDLALPPRTAAGEHTRSERSKGHRRSRRALLRAVVGLVVLGVLIWLLCPQPWVTLMLLGAQSTHGPGSPPGAMSTALMAPTSGSLASSPSTTRPAGALPTAGPQPTATPPSTATPQPCPGGPGQRSLAIYEAAYPLPHRTTVLDGHNDHLSPPTVIQIDSSGSYAIFDETFCVEKMETGTLTVSANFQLSLDSSDDAASVVVDGVPLQAFTPATGKWISDLSPLVYHLTLAAGPHRMQVFWRVASSPPGGQARYVYDASAGKLTSYAYTDF